MPLAQIDIPIKDHARIKAAGALLGLTLREFVIMAAAKEASSVLGKEKPRKSP